MNPDRDDTDDAEAQRYLESLVARLFREPLAAIAEQRRDIDEVALALNDLRKSVSGYNENLRSAARSVERAIDDGRDSLVELDRSSGRRLSAIGGESKEIADRLTSLAQQVSDQASAVELLGEVVESLAGRQAELAVRLDTLADSIEAGLRTNREASSADALRLSARTRQGQRIAVLGWTVLLVVLCCVLAAIILDWRA